MILSCIACSIYWMVNFLQLDPDFEATGFFGSSFVDAGGGFSRMVGFSPGAYFSRLGFNMIYPLLYPLRVATSSAPAGYQFLFSLCLVLQMFLLWRARIFWTFIISLLIASSFISAYPFPNLRYMTCLMPLVIILFCGPEWSQIRQDRLTKSYSH